MVRLNDNYLTDWPTGGWLTDLLISWTDGRTDGLTDRLKGNRLLVIRVAFLFLQAWPKERNDHRRRNLQRSTARPPKDSFWLPCLRHFLQGSYPRSPYQQHLSQVQLHRFSPRFLWHRRNSRWLLSQATFPRFSLSRPLPVCRGSSWPL